MKIKPEENYDLPRTLERHGYDLEPTVEEPVFVERLLERMGESRRYDILRNQTVSYLGDGKNVYRLEHGDSARSQILPGNKIEVRAECVGVCDPEDYESIKEELGFNSVFHFLDEKHHDAIEFDEKEGFVYPEEESEENTEGNFYSWGNAGRVVEKVRQLSN